MNDHVKTTRLTPEPGATMAPTVVAKTAVASTVNPTRPYGTAQPVAIGSQGGPRTRIAPIAGWLAVAAGLAALAFLVLRPSRVAPPVAPEPVAVLEIAHGSVDVLPVGSGRERPRLLALEAGQAITAGTVIETGSARGSGAGGVAFAAAGGNTDTGRAAIRLAGGHSVRFDTDTRVRVVSASALVLERGAVYVDSAGGRSGIEVRTTLGVVSDIGTQFEVRLADSAGEAALRVRVREGAVVLRRDGETHQAEAGVELAMTGDGTLTRGTAPIYGPEWDWVLEAVPMPDIEGRPLRHFLDWLARESGWTLRFADPATAELASATVLHGDVQGLSPRQATRMVFQGSGLGYRLEGGVFLVAQAAAGP